MRIRNPHKYVRKYPTFVWEISTLSDSDFSRATMRMHLARYYDRRLLRITNEDAFIAGRRK